MRTFINNHRTYFRRLVIVLALCVVAGVLLFAHYSAAATYTWDNGGGDGLWSTCTNWSSNLCPGSADIAAFTSSNITNSVIDVGYAGTVLGITIGSGYSGIITQQKNLTLGTSGYVQSTGTFNQGTTTINNAASYAISGGSFTSASGTNYVGLSLTFSGTGTYTASSSRVWNFNGGTGASFTYPGTFPSPVVIARTSGIFTFTIASGTILSQGVDFTGNVGGLSISSGATVYATSTPIGAGSLTVSGVLYASSTITLTGTLTVGLTGTLVYDPSTIYIGAGYIDNGGTFNKIGKMFVFEGSANGTITYPGSFPGYVQISKTTPSFGLTITSGTIFDKGVNLSSNVGNLTINSGAVVVATSAAMTADSLTLDGSLYASSTITLTSSFTLGSTGLLVTDASSMYVARNYTDNGGTFNSAGKTIVMNGTFASTFTYPGAFPGLVTLGKVSAGGSITIATTSVINITNSTSASSIRIYGTVRTGGNNLTVTSGTVTVFYGGVLGLYSTETLTSPILSSGSVVEYYGPSTYTTLNAGYSYSHVKFSAGTYNLTQNLTVAGDFTNTGSAFTQTSGTTTFSGTTTAITGNNTFYNFSKNIGASSTITFGSGNTQTITGALTLAGLNSSNRLTLAPGTPGSQWYINPQGTRTISYLSVVYGNNTNSTAVDCYTTGCVDGGNNTNFSFTAPQPTYRLKNGVRLRGGTRI